MDFCSFNSPNSDLILGTAIHDGHDLRPELAAIITLDDASRRREEDPHTGLLASRFAANLVVHRSRFEVDINRPRNGAVYRTPEEAWGLEVWSRPLTDGEIASSVQLYDMFYADLASVLDEMISRFGGFVVYDIHTYNHRRGGPDAEPEPASENPAVNLGTGTLPEKWRPVAENFLGALRTATLGGEPIDVRENVRFKGGHLARWVHERYGESGCALAIELKKVFMDEWSGELDDDRLRQLGTALLASTKAVGEAFSRI
jgi:N-formylglutamate amidohydrolase